MVLTQEKRRLLEKLSRDGVISALAFDQRGALKRMMAKYQTEEPTVDTPAVKFVKRNIPIYNPSSTKETALTKQSKYKFKNNDVDTIATEFTF